MTIIYFTNHDNIRYVPSVDRVRSQTVDVKTWVKANEARGQDIAVVRYTLTRSLRKSRSSPQKE